MGCMATLVEGLRGEEAEAVDGDASVVNPQR
jgi:hypothetical protein